MFLSLDDMASNPQPHKPTSRAQMLVNLAKGICNYDQNEDLNTSDTFMSNNYDPTQRLLTSDLNQNSPNIAENMEISLFEEQSEIGCSLPETSDDIENKIEKNYILDEITGQLREDKQLLDENEENYYLDERTGILRKKNTVCTNDDNYHIPETESSSSEQEISEKQRELNKLKRVSGKKYKGRKKKCNDLSENARYELVSKPKKYLKPKPCAHSSTLKSDRSLLCELMSEQKRKAVFDYFWGLTTWDAKKAYLKNLVCMRPILRRRKTTSNSEITSQRKLAYDYYLSDDQNITVKVCKNFFVSTFNISSDTLSEWIKKLQDYTNEGKDLRSKHEKRQSNRTTNPVPKVIRSTTVIDWLNLLNKVPSHYCRSSSNRVYVEDTFESKSHMFRVYTEWCKGNQKQNIGRKLFNQILEEKKISIFKPRKDQCDVCTAKKEGNISEEQYTLHIEKKNEAYNAHIEARALSSSEVLVLTVDVQSVLLCPKMLVSVQYYKQKLQVHNQSIYINNNKDVHLYVWHDGDGGVTANEFTSCLIHFIKSQLTYKKIIIISDGCSYQNKNKVLSSAMLKLTKETGLEIEQLILEKGHTMMQVDSVHSTLEKKFRPPIYTPSDYISRMREARPKQPYNVQHVDYTFFKNYEDDVCLDSIRPGKKAGDPTVNDIRALLYKNGSIFYKLRHPDEWKLLPQRLRSYNPTLNAAQLYNEPRKIDKNKYDSLQSLKPYMHRDYHTFYDSLHYKE